MVPRYDIVPIPPQLRDNLAQRAVQMFPPGTLTEFPAETAQSMFEFRADDGGKMKGFEFLNLPFTKSR